MGTNYYTRTKKCRTCGHKPEGIHLGKSSIGWQFSFQYNGGQYYKNIQEMKEWLKGKRIENEYGDAVSHKDFWALVDAKQEISHKNHAREVGRTGVDFVIGGYSFSDTPFS